MSNRDYYEILGVPRTATQDEVKSSYKKLAMQYHPDRNPNDPTAEDKFKEASTAYSVLSDATKRQRYDQFGHAGVNGMGGGYSDFTNINDIFTHFSDIFGGGGFGDIFGNSRRGRSARNTGERGSDIKIKLPLTVEEIAFGVNKTIKIKRLVHCPACKGTGAKNGTSKITCGTCNGAGEIRNVTRSMFGQFVNIQQCPTCSGSGQVVKEKCSECNGDSRVPFEDTIDINIPSGVEEDNYIPVSNKGNAGRNNGSVGDLIILISEQEHEKFKRMGDNVLYTLDVTFPDLVLGSEFEIDTLDGKQKVRIDAGSQPNDTIKLKDKGITKLRSTRRGEFIILLNLHIPKKINSKEKDLINELSQQENFSVRNINKKSKRFF